MMFKKMMKYEKAWNDFVNWFYYNIFDLYFCNPFRSMTEKEQILALNLIPSFMDEMSKGEIIIIVDLNIIFSCDYKNNKINGFKWFVFRKNDIYKNGYNETRQECLIQACEKAFEIKEVNNESI